MSYFRMDLPPHYHRRWTVSRLSSEWIQVVPIRHGRQGFLGACGYTAALQIRRYFFKVYNCIRFFLFVGWIEAFGRNPTIQSRFYLLDFAKRLYPTYKDSSFSIFSISSLDSLSKAYLYGQASRSISTGKLHALLHFHIPPIYVVVFNRPLGDFCLVRSHLEVGFPLRCFQRLSVPYLATRLCHWRDNRSTRGMSTPVLSY